MEKRKNYKMYIIIGCIFLLILFGGIGLFWWNHQLNSNENNRTLETTEKENEITEKIVYKILKDNDYNYYYLENENKKNLEELGEYTCEFKECESIVSFNNQDAKFIIYDNGYKFLTLEDNKINVQNLEELEKDNIYAIHIENNDLIVEYKNNSVGIYEVEPNQLKELFLENYTFNKIVNNKVIFIKGENFVIYDLEEKKIENEIYGPVSYLTIVENEKNKIYVVDHSIPGNFSDLIYNKEGKIIIDQGYFQILLHDGNIVMTDTKLPYIHGCGNMVVGYSGVQNFKMYQESTLIKTSKNYKSFMSFAGSDADDYFMAVDENDSLNVYDQDENMLFKVEDWNEEKILGYWELKNNEFIIGTEPENDGMLTETIYDMNGNIKSSKKISSCLK